MSKSKNDIPKTKKSHPEAKGLILLGISVIIFLSLISFIQGKPSENFLGMIGYSIGFGLQYAFGMGSYLVFAYLTYIGWNLLCFDTQPKYPLKTLYFLLFLISICVMLNVIAETHPPKNPALQARILVESAILKYPYPHKYIRYHLGGAPLYYIYKDLPTFNLYHLLSNVGIILTFSLTSLVSFILFTNISFLGFLKGIYSLFIASFKLLGRFFLTLKPKPKLPSRDYSYSNLESSLQSSPTRQTRNIPPSYPIYGRQTPSEKETFTNTRNDAAPKRAQEFLEKKTRTPAIKKKTLKIPTPSNSNIQISDGSSNKKSTIFKEETIYQSKPTKGEFKRYKIPPLTLLSPAKKLDQPTLKKDLRRQAEILEETLQNFGIDAKVGQINCGPTITSFEVHPPVGVKVQKIKVLENDIALNLQAKSIRIIAPIPGKAAVGVEIPSLYPQEVGFKEMLLNYKRKNYKYNLPILLGKTVSGDDVVCDLAKMPHCIIAGATGSGKSVCINTIVLSLLMNKRPDEVKLLLVDPKKVELSGYSKLPHMIAPVITEPNGALAALKWLVKEMHDRYELLKRLGLRNINSFNSRTPNKLDEAELGMEVPDKLPFIVGIIDEFADLMMQSGSELETPIARIAQMARAVGIHLILATQRPSREVITGIIKANFPTRISFKVASRINSQIILDENGAESLLGNGDLLFLPPGSSQLIRAQGVFIKDSDINKAIRYIRDQANTKYLIKSFDNMAIAEVDGKDAPADSLYEKAKEIVIGTQNASTTFLQRKLKIGYARAASLIDELEERGVIGEQEGSRGRKVLVKGGGK